MTPLQIFFSGVAVGAVLVGLVVIVLAIIGGIRERRATRQPPEVVRARGLELVK